MRGAAGAGCGWRGRSGSGARRVWGEASAGAALAGCGRSAYSFGCLLTMRLFPRSTGAVATTHFYVAPRGLSFLTLRFGGTKCSPLKHFFLPSEFMRIRVKMYRMIFLSLPEKPLWHCC